MADIKIVSWNIKDYTGKVFTAHGTKIVERVYSAAGDRLCEIFAVIEPMARHRTQRVGLVVDKGAGCEGILALYYALYARDRGWKVVPPRKSAAGTAADTIAIFYYSPMLTFTGPLMDPSIPVPTVTATLPAVTLAPGNETDNPLIGMGGKTAIGLIRGRLRIQEIACCNPGCGVEGQRQPRRYSELSANVKLL